jgi:hypothetical protein
MAPPRLLSHRVSSRGVPWRCMVACRTVSIAAAARRQRARHPGNLVFAIIALHHPAHVKVAHRSRVVSRFFIMPIAKIFERNRLSEDSYTRIIKERTNVRTTR